MFFSKLFSWKNNFLPILQEDYENFENGYPNDGYENEREWTQQNGQSWANVAVGKIFTLFLPSMADHGVTFYTPSFSYTPLDYVWNKCSKPFIVQGADRGSNTHPGPRTKFSLISCRFLNILKYLESASHLEVLLPLLRTSGSDLFTNLI